MLRSLSWVGLGYAAQSVAQVLVLAILSRLLTPTEFGVVAIVLAIINVASIFSELGVSTAIIQWPKISDVDLRVGFTLTSIASVAIFTSLWIGAPSISSFMGIPEHSAILRAAGILLILRTWAVIPEALLVRQKNFRVLAWIQLGGYLLVFPGVSLSLAWMGFGAWAVVIAHLAQSCWRMLCISIAAKKLILPIFRWRDMSNLARYSLPYTVGRMLSSVANEADRFIAGKFLGATSLGLYTRAHQLGMLPASFIGQVLDRVLFTSLARLQHAPPLLTDSYIKFVFLVALFALPGSSVGMILAPELVEVVLGTGWESVVWPLRIFFGGLFFRVGYKVSDSYAKSVGALRGRAWRNGLFASVVVVASLIGQTGGVVGLSIGITLSVAVNYIVAAQQVIRLSHIRWPQFFQLHCAPILIAVVIGVTLWPVSRLLTENSVHAVIHLMVCVLLASTIFLVLLLVMLRQTRVWLVPPAAALSLNLQFRRIQSLLGGIPRGSN